VPFLRRIIIAGRSRNLPRLTVALFQHIETILQESSRPSAFHYLDNADNNIRNGSTNAARSFLSGSELAILNRVRIPRADCDRRDKPPSRQDRTSMIPNGATCAIRSYFVRLIYLSHKDTVKVSLISDISATARCLRTCVAVVADRAVSSLSAPERLEKLKGGLFPGGDSNGWLGGSTGDYAAILNSFRCRIFVCRENNGLFSSRLPLLPRLLIALSRHVPPTMSSQPQAPPNSLRCPSARLRIFLPLFFFFFFFFLGGRENFLHILYSAPISRGLAIAGLTGH